MYKDEDRLDMEDMWLRVHDFSSRVRDVADKDNWKSEYLMGAFRELSSLAALIPFGAPHRNPFNYEKPVDYAAIAEEAVDTMNYLVALMGQLGINRRVFRSAWESKMAVLEQRFYQEHTAPVDSHRFLIMVDLDGVVADFRTGIRHWLSMQPEIPEEIREGMRDNDICTTLHLDIELGIDPHLYRTLKARWEAARGYRHLKGFPRTSDVFDVLTSAKNQFGDDLLVAFVTSRPEDPRNVWADTFEWIQENWSLHDSDPRFHLIFTKHKSEWVKATGLEVLACLEDEPNQVRRLAQGGSPVIMPVRGYNRDLTADGANRAAPESVGAALLSLLSHRFKEHA